MACWVTARGASLLPPQQKGMNMKPLFAAGFLAGLLLLLPVALSSRSMAEESKQASSSAKTSQGGAASAKEALPFPDVPRITAEEVARLMKDKGSIVLVDTDDPEVYEAEHIQGAINIPFDPTGDIRDKDQTLSVLPGDRLIVFYCNCPHEEDSAPMVQEMWQLGYDRDKVKTLEGGLNRWEKLGYPLVGTDVKEPAAKGD
jgi:rhodanese-related sulfurtransferase